MSDQADVDWHIVLEAVSEAYSNGEGLITASLLEREFARAGLLVAHSDTASKP